jgi:hypothetical protein
MSNTKNKISHLRDHLFAVLEALQDKDEPMDLERARTVAAVAQVIVNTATAETKHMQVTGSLQGTGFIPDALPEAPTPIALRSISRGGGA